MATVDALLADWYARRQPVSTERTNATNRAPVVWLMDFFKGKTPDEIDQPGMDWLRNALLNGGKSKETVARYLSTLRAACGDALEHVEIGKMIAELKRHAPEVEVWTRDEARDLIEAAEGLETIHEELRFLFGTGARRGEMLALQFDDLDFERSRIHLRRSLQLDGETQNGTKWGKARWVPMAQSLRSMLDEKRVDNDVLHYTDYRVFGRLWTQSQFRQQFERVRRLSGVRPFKLHTTRHTAISWALSSGMSLRKASEIFGVSQATLEKHYAHWVDDGDVDMSWVEG